MMKADKAKKERRRAPRGACRLPCSIMRGRERLRARVLDVSEAGLCLLSPVWLKAKQELEIAIDVPGAGVSRIRAEIWHIRREKSRGTGNRVWIAGAILVDADEAYESLLRAVGVSPDENADASDSMGARIEVPVEHPPASAAPSAAGSNESCESGRLDEIEPMIYRIRCKAKGEPRSRVLTLAAETEEQARALAIRDLGNAWSILEIREAR